MAYIHDAPTTADLVKTAANLKITQVWQKWLKLLVSEVRILQADGGGIPTNEIPAGVVDGSNDTFTLPSAPITGSLMLFQNGILLTLNVQYSLSGTTITFSIPPLTGDNLMAFYRA